MTKPHLPVDELRKIYWDIRQDEKDDVNHEDEAVARIEALITAETQKAISRVLDEVEKIIGDFETQPDKRARNADMRRDGRNQLRAEQRATLKKLRGDYGKS